MGKTPSDVYIALIKADLGEEVATIASDFVRESRFEAQYELYKDVARLKGNRDLAVSLETFKNSVNSDTVDELFEQLLAC